MCCGPTLPLPPLFTTKPGEGGADELRLRAAVSGFRSQLAALAHVRVCSPQAIDLASPAAGRRDLRSELGAGFPYSLAHASAVGRLLADLIAEVPPKKGLITDLDETLWAGAAGEVGADAVSWELDSHSQRHGLYQQLLGSLASAGVLIAAASRNDPAVVAEALRRPDLLLADDAVFPIEASWDPKSGAVRRILDTWNVAADAVVFVDDDPLELDEVAAGVGAITCLRFPDSDDELMPFLTQLRDLFGKSATRPEDALRLESIRAAPTRHTGTADYLAHAAGVVRFGHATADEGRALELINKTNQFNLNGRRLTESAFTSSLRSGSSRLVVASYEDRYGPLGTIAAIVVSGGATVESWVMSCRALSRRIEHHCLARLFAELETDELLLAYEQTPRNAPFGRFLESVGAGRTRDGTVTVARGAFEARTPELVHEVR